MQLFNGLALISVLIIISRKIRFKTIPFFIFAGFLGLILGEQFFNIIKWKSFRIGIVPEFLITAIFTSVPFQVRSSPVGSLKKIKHFWGYNTLLIYLQWVIGLSVVLIFNDIPKAFATVLPAGFIGGHSTALALGEFYSKNGWPDGFSLFTSSATLGFIVSIIGAIFLCKTSKISISSTRPISFSPKSLFTSLILLSTIMIISYLSCIPLAKYNIPWFIPSFLVAHIFKYMLKTKFLFLNKIKSDFHKMNHIFTTYLIVISLTLLNIDIILKYKTPLLFVFSIGVSSSILMFKYLAPKMMLNNSNEKALMSWGWTTGVVAVALALNQAYSKEDKRDLLLEEFSLCYLLLSPIELLMLISTPILITKLNSIYLILCLLVFSIITFKFTKAKLKDQVLTD